MILFVVGVVRNYLLVLAISMLLIVCGSVVLADSSLSGEIHTEALVDIPTISEYEPSYGYTYVASQPIVISGSHFYNGVSANLTNGTYRQRNSTPVLWSGFNSVTPSFDLRGLNPGKYWIDLYNPQGYESPRNFSKTWGSRNPLQEPRGVFVDAFGNVFVVDAYYDKIQKFNAAGEFIASWGSYGSGDGQFSYPNAICADTAGSLYVVDPDMSRVQKFSSSGIFEAKWGEYGTSSGQFNNPRGICINSTGYLYVTDAGNNRIQIFNSAGQYQYELSLIHI